MDAGHKRLKGYETLKLARLYESWGFVPIPIQPGAKRPFGKGWQFTEHYNAIDKIKSALWYFEWEQDLNVGILCGAKSGIVVLDIDAREGGVERWNIAAASHEPVSTFTVKTGGGGLHMYFKYSAQTSALKNAANCLGKGWDIRTDGGQVVGPFSIHPETGKVYLPISGFGTTPCMSCDPNEVMRSIQPFITEMPDWIIGL